MAYVSNITSDTSSNVFFKSPLVKHASVGHLNHNQIISLNFASIIFEIEDVLDISGQTTCPHALLMLAPYYPPLLLLRTSGTNTHLLIAIAG